jgi:hypothetical protein
MGPVEQTCPPINLGSQATLQSEDVFNGRAVQIVQPGRFSDGSEGYVAKLLPEQGYIGVTTCELVNISFGTVQSIQSVPDLNQEPLPVTPRLQMLYSLWQLTLGESWLYGNAIGLTSGRPDELAQTLIDEGRMLYNAEAGQYHTTDSGVQELRDAGLIE